MSHLRILPHFEIPLSEFEITYARSSGPGGQNVNKVNSKAVLRWDLVGSPSVPLILRPWLLQQLAGMTTREGHLLVTSDRFRDQGRNRDDVLEKLCELLVRMSARPKARKDTKPTRSSVRKTRTAKSLNSQKKQNRSKNRGHHSE